MRKSSRYSRSPAQRYSKANDKKRYNERKSRSRSLSYSPARRNPEKYKEILDKNEKPNERGRKPAPVVKLHPNTSDQDSVENDTRGESKVEDFLPIDRNQDKELNRLKALKSELAVKAKESLEKKIISETSSTSSSKPGRKDASPPVVDPERAREMEIVAQTVAINTKEKQAAVKERDNRKKISIKPFKINDNTSPMKAEEARKEIGPKLLDVEEKGRKSRSRSKGSKR